MSLGFRRTGVLKVDTLLFGTDYVSKCSNGIHIEAVANEVGQECSMKDLALAVMIMERLRQAGDNLTNSARLLRG